MGFHISEKANEIRKGKDKLLFMKGKKRCVCVCVRLASLAGGQMGDNETMVL